MLHGSLVGHVEPDPLAALQPGRKAQTRKVLQLGSTTGRDDPPNPGGAGLLPLLDHSHAAAMALVRKSIQENQAGWIGLPQGCNQGHAVRLLIGQFPTARPPHTKQQQGPGTLRRQGLVGLGPEGRKHRAARPFRHQGAA